MINFFKKKGLRTGDIVRPSEKWIEENVYPEEVGEADEWRSKKWVIRATDGHQAIFTNKDGVWHNSSLQKVGKPKPILFKDMA